MKQLLRSSILLCTLLIASFEVMAQLNVSVTVDRHISCPGGDDAQITVNISGAGNGTVVVEWRDVTRILKDNVLVDGPSASVTFPLNGKLNTQLPTGEIFLKIVDISDLSNISEVTETITINQPKPLNSIVNYKDGEFEIVLPSHDEVYTYEFSIDEGKTFHSMPNFNGVIAGEYTLVMRVLSKNTSCLVEEIITISAD